MGTGASPTARVAISPRRARSQSSFFQKLSGLVFLSAYPRTGRGEGDRHILLTGHRKMSQSPPVLG